MVADSPRRRRVSVASLEAHSPTAVWTTINVSQLKSDPQEYLRRVAAGETLNIVRRRRIVARIQPAGNTKPHCPVSTESAKDNCENISAELLGSYARRCIDRVTAGATIDVRRFGKSIAQITAFDDD